MKRNNEWLNFTNDGDYNPFVMPDSNEPEVAKIKPQEGLCLKTKDKTGNKLFINFCHSTELPPPKDLDEDELSEILTNSDEETVNYRVPISLGEGKHTYDKSGNPCVSHDVVINSDFFKKVEKSVLFRNFVIQVAFEGLEDKYKIEIVKTGWVILKNRKYIGTMSDVTVRIGPAPPLITEISSISNESPQIERKQGTSKQSPIAKFEEFPPPEYKIIQVPAEGHPAHLVGEFRMPLLLKSSEIQLDLGEDRIVMCVTNKYYLDIFIPYLIDQDESRAEVNVDSLVLTVTMPVLPK